jgi:hypothetical protein
MNDRTRLLHLAAKSRWKRGAKESDEKGQE